MASYETFLLQCNPSKLKIEFLHTINDRTLVQGHMMVCNAYCTGNAYVLTDSTYTTKLKNKAEMRKFVAIAKRVKKKSIKLVRVDNSMGFTRLIYGFE